jgi:hypothetical protein
VRAKELQQEEKAQKNEWNKEISVCLVLCSFSGEKWNP